jgi:hypothetical protein
VSINKVRTILSRDDSHIKRSSVQMVKTGYLGGQAVDRSYSPVATLHCTPTEDPPCGTGSSVSVPSLPIFLLSRLQVLVHMLIINIVFLLLRNLVSHTDREHGLRVFENALLRKTYGVKRDEVTGW